MYKSLNDVPVGIRRFYEEHPVTQRLWIEDEGHKEGGYWDEQEEGIEVVLTTIPEAHFAHAAQAQALRQPRGSINQRLRAAIAWEDFDVNHNQYLVWEEAYAAWVAEQPMVDSEEQDEEGKRVMIVAPAPMQPVVDLETRRSLYEVVEEVPSGSVRLTGEYEDTFNDELLQINRTPSTEPLTKLEVTPHAKLVRDAYTESNIFLYGVEWQVDKAGRDNLNEAINYALRKQLPPTSTRNWILADNSIREATLKELMGVMDGYTERMDEAFEAYALWRSAPDVDYFNITDK